MLLTLHRAASGDPKTAHPVSDKINSDVLL